MNFIRGGEIFILNQLDKINQFISINIWSDVILNKMTRILFGLRHLEILRERREPLPLLITHLVCISFPVIKEQQ